MRMWWHLRSEQNCRRDGFGNLCRDIERDLKARNPDHGSVVRVSGNKKPKTSARVARSACFAPLAFASETSRHRLAQTPSAGHACEVTAVQGQWQEPRGSVLTRWREAVGYVPRRDGRLACACGLLHSYNKASQLLQHTEYPISPRPS